MKSKITSVLFIFLVLVSTQYSRAQKSNVLIGTYTNISTGKSKGIYVYEFDAATGRLTYKSVMAVSNPSYLTISPDHKYVYAVSEDHAGMLNAYKYNSASGQLTFLNRTSSGGDEPCYVSTDATGKYVFAANYTSGSLSATPVQKDGSLGSGSRSIKHTGSSIDKSRQGEPHVHSILITPENKYVFTMDLGTDKINVYNFDLKKASVPLSPATPPFVNITAGSGPRHFTFHPNNKYAYGICELNSTVTAFRYSDGHLTQFQTIPMLPQGFKGKCEAADIHISADGKFLYASNRGAANEIVIYSIDQKDGKLTYVGRQSSMGKAPRNFTIDLTGNFLLVANQDTNNIFVFKRDQKTGLLSYSGQKIDVGSPVCLKFVKID